MCKALEISHKRCYIIKILVCKCDYIQLETVLNTQFFELKPDRERAKTIIFLSGSGSNAEVLLKLAAKGASPEYEIVALATDRPNECRAIELADIFNLPLISHDIKEFYHSRDEKVSVATERGRELRKQWTQEFLVKIAPYAPDFAIFAGFVPLCDLNEAFPCLNVHPGDLTVEDKNGDRLLVGLHTIPVESAILMGKQELRSSVILVESLEAGDKVDAGPILGVSEPMPIDFMDYTLEQLQECAKSRPSKRPIGGHKDALAEVASHNQDLLKYAGDHLILPKTAARFAQNLYGLNENGGLVCREHGSIKTIEFFKDGRAVPIF